MGDEDRSRELPQRLRGPVRAGPAPPAPPVLSEELRRRMRAAVQAERGEAIGKGQRFANGPPRSVTTPAGADGDLMTPGVNGRDGAVKPEPVGRPGRTIKRVEPVTPEPAVNSRPAEGRPASHRPDADARAESDRSAHAPVKVRKKPERRHFVSVRLVTTALVLIAAGSLGAAVTTYFTSSQAESRTPSPARAQPQESPTGKEAAAWVAQQVNRDDTVSCDPVMCAALTADGFPSRSLLVLGPESSYPVKSAVVVETAAVQGLFGTSLNNYAPDVLAAFGTGDSQVTVRIIAPHGATAYYSALRADLADRKATGNDLLQVSGITVSPTARQQLIEGQPSSRLLLAIVTLASDQPTFPIDIVQFGNIGPGAATDIPLRFADLAESVPAAHMPSSAYVRSMRAYLRALPADLHPASIETLMDAGGEAVLRIQFAAPSPLGLFNPSKTP